MNGSEGYLETLFVVKIFLPFVLIDVINEGVIKK